MRDINYSRVYIAENLCQCYWQGFFFCIAFSFFRLPTNSMLLLSKVKEAIHMKPGDIVFLKDEFFQRFPDQSLMSNKPTIDGKEHQRPYLIALQDTENPNIFWAVPFSSKIEKFKQKYQRTMEKYNRRDTLRFGYFKNKLNAFLLQNMCPVTINYVNKHYLNSFGRPETISNKLRINISSAAKNILVKSAKGIKLTYANLSEMRDALETELSKSFSFYEDEATPDIVPKKDKVTLQEQNPIQSFCDKWMQQHNKTVGSTDMDEETDFDIEP